MIIVADVITEVSVKNWLAENNKALFYLWQAQSSLTKNTNNRDLGKLFAEANEYIVRDWINSKTSLTVVQRDDFSDDPDASGYDLLTDDGLLKLQVKLRATDIHLEQTRRHSKKNVNSGDTGHIRYSVGEADVFIFSRPDVDDYLDIDKWGYIAIPEIALVDPKNLNYLVPRVNKSLWTQYVGRAVEVLEDVYASKK